MNRSQLMQEIDTYGQFLFSRSSGPGGQNINKVSTKVQLSIVLEDIPSLEGRNREELSERLSRRVRRQQNGSFFLVSQLHRSQHANRKHCVERMCDLIIEASLPEADRKPTRPTTASKQRRLERKRVHSRKKAARRSGGSKDY